MLYMIMANEGCDWREGSLRQSEQIDPHLQGNGAVEALVGIKMDLPVYKTEAWLAIIGKDATFGGKETLRLAPIDGGLQGTNYYFRAP